MEETVLSRPGIGTDLSGKRAVVTGSATGIGRAIARALTRHGVRVAVADLNLAAAKKVASELPGAVPVEVDVTRRASVEQALRQAADHLGGYDIVAANAGVSTMNPALDLTDEEWDHNFSVNTKGVFLTNQISARYFVARGSGGVIVNTASLAAKVGAPLLAHYSASKFAVLGWTQALARELAPKGIRVNAVCPGFVKTGMQSREVEWEARLRGVSQEQVIKDYVAQTPLGRLETPEDVADLVVFLCSSASGFMTGQGINITGGVYMT